MNLQQNGQQTSHSIIIQVSTIYFKSDDLSTLSVQLYEPIIHEMLLHQVPSEYVAASLCQYVENWVSATSQVEGDESFAKRMSQREAIKAVERLLPRERGLLPCNLLFEMFRLAMALEATTDCRNGFEVRIVKQLDQATVKEEERNEEEVHPK